MRQMKFRAWDKNNKIMVTDGFYITFDGRSKTDAFGFMGSYELQQFTGILDNNGVDIYEGDIIKSDYLGQTIAEVIYICSSFGFFRDRGLSTEFVSIPIRHPFYNFPLEVIGNIYQHPELLKENE